MFALSEHNEQLSGDTLTTLTLNYEWRQIIGSLLDWYLNRLVSDFGGSNEITYYNKVRSLLDDLYSSEDTGVDNVHFVNVRETSQAINISSNNLVAWSNGDLYDSSNPTRMKPSVAGFYLVVANVPVDLDATFACRYELQRNGSLFFAIERSRAAINHDSTLCGVIYLNGTSDYVEVNVFPSDDGNIVTSRYLPQLHLFGTAPV